MNAQSAVSKLVLALRDLDDSELEMLSQIFSRPSTVRLLGRLLDNYLQLRRAVSTSQILPGLKPDVGSRNAMAEIPQVSRDMTLSADSGQQLRSALLRTIMDRSLFNSTHEVIKAINDSFGFAFKYEEVRRGGRRDLFKKCWSKLLLLPEEHRLRAIFNFLEKAGPVTKDKEIYNKLFRILARNE